MTVWYDEITETYTIYDEEGNDQEELTFDELQRRQRTGGGIQMSEEFNQIAYQNDYIKQKYDRINLTVPKGRKEEIKKKAEAQGMSVNQYINKLLDEDK